MSLIKERTDDFTKKLSVIEKDVKDTFLELGFRKNFSTFLMLLFAGMAVVIVLLSKEPKD